MFTVDRKFAAAIGLTQLNDWKNTAGEIYSARATHGNANESLSFQPDGVAQHVA